MKSEQEQFDIYGELGLSLGVNLQDGQGLIINAPVEAQYLVERIAEKAYQKGAKNVHVEWGSDRLKYLKLKHAPEEVLQDFPDWKKEALEGMVKDGYALLSLYGEDPDLLKEVNPERVATANRAAGKALSKYSEYVMKDKVTWTVLGYPTQSWARKVFPELSPKEAKTRLWESIFETMRMDRQDPVQAWKEHNETLRQAREYLNRKEYKKLIYKSPVTDLEIELPKGHIWHGGSAVSESGIEFNPNMPTEEVFTMPHKYGVNGKVASTKPFSYGGNVINHFTLYFKDGEITEYHAEEGEETLKLLLESDEGALRLGEVALVPYDSPISKSGLLYFNTLFDENASCHLAIGKAYPTNIQNGSELAENEMDEKGVNDSIIHEDFMVGSADLDIDGVTADGKTEPVFRKGNWAVSFSD